MAKPVNAKTTEEFLDMLEPGRKEQLKKLDALIKETVPTLKPWLAYNMLGYGVFKYKNYKKEVIDWPVVSVASQKAYMSIYVCALDHTNSEAQLQYIAERYADKLCVEGVKPNVGKSCIRFKKIEDLDLDVLRTVLVEAQKQPGLIA